MHSAGSYVLRDFFAATNWCPENHYSALSLTSRRLLDFPIPPGLNLSLSNRPTSKFLSSLSLSALVPTQSITYPPTSAPILGPPLSNLLAGQLTYISSSVELGEIINTKRSSLLNKGRFKLKDISQSFKVGNLPLRPDFRDGAQPIWQGGERVDKQGKFVVFVCLFTFFEFFVVFLLLPLFQRVLINHFNLITNRLSTLRKTLRTFTTSRCTLRPSFLLLTPSVNFSNLSPISTLRLPNSMAITFR